jgi:hypothetical protein
VATPSTALHLTGDQDLIDAIAGNQDFPETGDVPLGKLSAGIDSPQPSWTLPAPSGSVTLAISANASADLGVYGNPKMLLNDLGFGADAGATLSFDISNAAASRYLVFRCGYNASGSLNGTMALSPYGSVNFGVDGHMTRMFAVIRREVLQTKAGDAFKDLQANIVSPWGVTQLLPAGTWIISECDGQVAATLGVTAGYTLNWVHSLNLQGLSGDVGMKIAAGASLALGASVAGKFYLVLSCDDDASVVRYRLFRSSTKGWNFALKAELDVTPSTGTLLPSDINDLLKGIFGIHDAQLLKYLQAANLDDLANAGLSDLVKALDPSGDVQTGLSKLQNLFGKWQSMPQDVTRLIWKHAGDNAVVAKLTNVATALANSNQQSLSGILGQLLHTTTLDSDPAAQWLEAAADKDIFSLYEDSAAGTQIRSAAKQLLGILDGSDIQSTLQKLQGKVNTMLDLPTLESAVASGNLANIATWVQKRLAQFLGINPSGLAGELNKIDQIVQKVRAKADQLYSAALKALHSTYSFSLSYAYQASDTRTALVDAEFGASVMSALHQAVAGNIADLLSRDIPGVQLNAATLTHSIRREGKLEIHLPHYVSTADHLLSGASQDRIVNSEAGRMHLFEATAKDEDLERGNNSVQRYAALSLGIAGVATAVRKHDVQSVDFGYEIRNLRSAMCRSEFQTQYGPVVQQYFATQFGEGTSDPNRASFDSWVIEWDKFTDAHPEQTPAGDGVIGNVWSDMQLQFSSEANVTWMDALLNSKQLDFLAMAVAMQRAYRVAVLRSYLSDPKNLTNLSGPSIDAFFCWVSLPTGKLDTRPDVLAGPITSDTCVNNLSGTRAAISAMLSGIPALRKYAQFWDPRPTVVRNWLAGLAEDQGGRVPRVVDLLYHEMDMIATAQKGFQAVQRAGAGKLDQTLDALVAAGLDITSAFNSKMGTIFDRAHVVRYFGPLMFQAAVEALFPGNAPAQVDARLEVAVLNTAQMPANDDPPATKDILLRQVLVNFG